MTRNKPRRNPLLAEERRLLAQFAADENAQLVPALQAVQELYGFLPRGAIRRVAGHFGLPPGQVYNLARLHRPFRFQPVGRFHVQVCRGTACHLKGSGAVLDQLQMLLDIQPGQTTHDGLFSLEAVDCIGACSLSPAVCVNGAFHAHVAPEAVEQIIDHYRRQSAAAEQSENDKADGEIDV